MAGPLPLGEPAPLDGSLPNQAALSSGQRTFHVYVHIPFCRVRCGYCDFNTYTATELQDASQSNFADVLIKEIRLSRGVIRAAEVASRPITSVFFGGGTPTQLPAADLVKILSELRDVFAQTEAARSGGISPRIAPFIDVRDGGALLQRARFRTTCPAPPCPSFACESPW